MRFVSTRNGETASLDTALLRGLARDGGLFLPEPLPRFVPDDFASAQSIVDSAEVLLRPFFAGSALAAELRSILEETFSFPVPVTPVAETVGLLELFHGPTAAFKDVGAGFLAACLARLEQQHDRPLTILVATSGDTGSAVAAAFDGRPGTQVVLLYPEGRVSERQARQLSGWSDNVLSVAVDGSFDDCQALVKQALANEGLAARYRFTSANSINIGRLLPQCSYYAHASLMHYRQSGRKPGFVVPTGNLGNGLACLLARRMGLPIGPIVLATNANRVIPDYLQGAEWQPRTSIRTLASAMDVGNPSNMERLLALQGEGSAFREELSAVSVSDEQIRAQLRKDFDAFGFATCPHTATATFALGLLPDEERAANDWIVVATAHPAKFEQIVEPLIGEAVPLPESLRGILSRPMRFVSIGPDLESLAAAMETGLPS
jgi:threonine synthase